MGDIHYGYLGWLSLPCGFAEAYPCQRLRFSSVVGLTRRPLGKLSLSRERTFSASSRAASPTGTY